MTQPRSDEALDGRAPSALGATWLGGVRERVEAELRAFFEVSAREASALASGETWLFDVVRELTLRPAKRLRPMILLAGFEACAPSGEEAPAALDRIGAALELFQSYLLIHDDWMDRDTMRRARPTVHVLLRERVGDPHLGDALAVLAGDLASALAWERMLGAVEGLDAAPALVARFIRMHREVVVGQELDLRASGDVARMHALKTGSYTIEGPLELGALLAGASAARLAALRELAAPIGRAFQIRDDLHGMFATPEVTGKPRFTDLRAGRRTALVLEHELHASDAEREVVERVLGRASATDDELLAALAAIERSFARARVEAELARLLELARTRVASAGLEARGVRKLLDLVSLLDAS